MKNQNFEKPVSVLFFTDDDEILLIQDVVKIINRGNKTYVHRNPGFDTDIIIKLEDIIKIEPRN